MNNAIIIQIARSDFNKMSVDLHRAPNMPDQPEGARTFECDAENLPPWADQEAVRKRGEMLLDILRKASSDVKFALDGQLRAADNDSSCPIYFWLKNVGEAEQLCWEALCDSTKDFLALNRRWPIGRIAGSRPSREVDLTQEPIDDNHPLRIALVLAAAKVPGSAQWEGFYKAVVQARQDGLPIKLRVMVGEEALCDQIVNQAIQDPALEVLPISNRGIQLETALDDFAPHLVHFFCHGSTSHNKPRLEIAHFLSWNGPTDEQRHIELNLEQLKGIRGVKNAWLVTLNCCEGGAATKEMLSLTYSLVRDGVAAAVGMVESVDAADANELCTHLYPAVFREIREALQKVHGGMISLEWAGALYAPRTALRDRHNFDPRANREWTLPVLYVQPEPLKLFAGAAHTVAVVGLSQEAQRTHRETIEGLLSNLPPGPEAAALRQALANLL